MYHIHIIDKKEQEATLPYEPYEYNSIMELLENEFLEDWGDCRGRAMCGTCHIEILEGNLYEEADDFECNTIEELPNQTTKSRLACQIIPDESIHNLKFRILKDD